MERLSDTAINIINDLHKERLDYTSEYSPLIDALNRLAEYEDAEAEGRLVVLPCSAEDMKMCIEELDLSVRTYNCLKFAGINTVGQLLKLSDEQIANIRNIGKISFEEIKAKIAKFKAENCDRR